MAIKAVPPVGEGSMTQEGAGVRAESSLLPGGWHLSSRGQPGLRHLESFQFTLFFLFFHFSPH